MSSSLCCITLFVTFFLIPFANSVSFQISRFGPDTTDILYEGDAVASVGEIEFNKANYLCRVAHAIYREKVPLWDPDHSTKLADFSTHFSFTIDTQNRSSYGHGIAFFLAPVGFQIPPNSDGGFLGLFNTTTSDSARSQIVAVEFDSFSNTEWDPPFEHVGINNNSIASSAIAPWNVSLHSGNPIDAWITYNATTKNLSVFWNYGTGLNLTISYIINLRDVLPPWVTIGFSAATDPGTGKSDAGLVEYVWDLYGKGKLLSVVDEKLHMDFEQEQVERLMITGLWCAHPESNLRPSIRQAIHVLNFEASLPNIPMKMPVPVYYLPSTCGDPAVISSGDPTMTYTSIDVGR
ncbi:hypothetical protein K7X08_005147 [Anisodus acutangulus]|uniref:Legume lectin domain-containing protein n=1 Tax=Anisodus acutangulus TaxID=402998 RepID=A0A9Q1MHX8_9SOLA|nr:hypothetical protein K7X08_005147 [Anisodus acutangulus]